MAKKTQAEKDAEKAEKERKKAEKALAKAEKKYQKAMEKAAKKKDPEKREKAERKATEKMMKSVEKTTKKYPDAVQEIFNERQEAMQAQAQQARTAAPAEQILQPEIAPQPIATNANANANGVSSAYGNQQATDIYGNPIQSQQSGGQSQDGYGSGQSQEEQPKDLSEALTQLAMKMIELMMQAYMGPEFGYIGDRYQMRGDQFDAQVDARNQAAQVASKEYGNDLDNSQQLQQQPIQDQVRLQEAPQPVISEPMTEKEQKSFNNWMKQMNIPEEQQEQLKEKYGEKGAYNIVQKCMTEPKNVMDTAGESFRTSKKSIEYFAELDVSQPENKAKADKVIAMDPPKLNMALVQARTGGR